MSVLLADMNKTAMKNDEYTKLKKNPCALNVAVVDGTEENLEIKDNMFRSVIEIGTNPENKSDKTRMIICRTLDDYIYVVNWFYSAPYIRNIDDTHRKLQVANISVKDVRDIRGAEDALEYSEFLNQTMIKEIDDKVLLAPKKFKRFSECFR